MSNAKEKLLDTAEGLFHHHGYSSVSMRDIASNLGMKKASLYYHIPHGKEQLYVEVTERMFERHHHGIEAAIAAGQDTEDKLFRVAHWIFSQPPMYLFKMMDGDMPELSPESAAHLGQRANELLFRPIEQLFKVGVAAGDIRPMSISQLTGTFLTLMEGVAFAGRHQFERGLTLDTMIDNALDLLINGVKPRN